MGMILSPCTSGTVGLDICRNPHERSQQTQHTLVVKLQDDVIHQQQNYMNHCPGEIEQIPL